MAKSLKAQFADWVAQQPRDGEYNYGDPCGCAFHQFLTAHGYPVRLVGGFDWADTDGVFHELPAGLADALLVRPRTFGALADKFAS